ncbi:MAG: tetratricopeptide repeat protein [Planctomycetes bacterium]|nr:tetratricopeptide repeat protein [Planctomycetota bacterium]
MTSTAPGSPRLRALATALLWLAVAAVVATLLLGERDPARATVLQVRVLGALGTAGVWLGGVAAVALALWPPVWPWLRVRWSGMKDRMSTDPTPYREALGRLAHFESAPDLVQVGRYLLRQGNLAAAVRHLARAAELEPDNPQTRLLLARALLRSGAVGPAAEQAFAAVRLDERCGFGEALVLLGDALHRLQRDDDAERALAHHEQLFGGQREADLLRARIAQAQGRTEDARRLARRAAAPPADAVRLRPTDALARAQARVLCYRLGTTPGRSEGSHAT